MEIGWGFNILSTLALFVTSLVLFYAYGKQRNRFLRNAGFDGPEPMVFLGNILQMSKEGFIDCFHKYAKKYGKVYGLYFGGGPAVVVTDLDIVREVLVRQFHNFSDRTLIDLNPKVISTGILFEKGETWKRLRGICSPSFSVSKIKLLCDRINKCSEVLSDKLMKCARENKTVVVKDYMGAFTLDVIASTAFGMEMDSQNDPNNRFVVSAKRLLADDFTKSPALLLAVAFPGTVPFLRWLGVTFFPKAEMNCFVDVVTNIISERKRQPISEQSQSVDFLQLLLNAEADETDVQTSGSATGKSSKRMSTDEIIGQAFLFLLAGYDTTATALTFTAHALATNPNIQELLVSEIDNVLGDETPTYDNINQLKYLDHTINESLRLYPPIPSANRVVKNTVSIKGYTFPKDASVSIPFTVIHRDPELYPDPLSFKPERWEEKNDMDPLSFLPFGYGPRICIGMRLALMEVKIALVHILRRIVFSRLPETQDVVEFGNAPVLVPKQPIKLRLRTR